MRTEFQKIKEVVFHIPEGKKSLESWLEEVGRTCYLSEDKITEESCYPFIKRLINSNHMSIIEHLTVTVRFLTNRAIANELVRHRIASFAQSSTRYCNFSKNRFNNEIAFIFPSLLTAEQVQVWEEAVSLVETTYFKLLDLGCSPEKARDVLPLSLATEIVMTTNLREWLHFFNLRCSSAAHPMMRELAKSILAEFVERIPVIFRPLADEIKP